MIVDCGMWIRYLEKNNHAVCEGFEVEDFVDAVRLFHVHEERHAEDGVDEHYEHEQQADVEQRRHRDEQREQQGPYALGRLDEAQDAADAEDSDHTQQRRRRQRLQLLFQQFHWAQHHRRLLTDRLKSLTLYGHIKTAEQRIIIQQYGDWYTGR